ncbi:MAG: FixH family protein [Bacteroidota bacterium]|nr:FixH family protein [Bacteroidota bacterium]
MNWGNRLLIAFIVFGAGMSYLVWRSMNTNYEMVEKDYYKSELRYQEVIDGSNRANALSGPVKLEQTNNGLVLQLPAEMKGQDISGSVLFYCAYDSKRDKNFELKTDSRGAQIFEKGKITPGSYTMKIGWNANGKYYYTERTITIS